MPRGPRLDEGWRQPVVDLSIAKDFGSDAHVLDVSNWLVQRQPISLAVNGDLALSVKLWERTAMVVVTVGGCDGRPPASTCQARPQDGEILRRGAAAERITKPHAVPRLRAERGAGLQRVL